MGGRACCGVQFYCSLGINVTAIGVQNESNWSHEGTQTCRWEPERLKTFIEQFINPRLKANQLSDILVALLTSPTLAPTRANSAIPAYL